jgi:hypothetical protein
MKKIFISYSRSDRQAAEKMKSHLTAMAHTVWIDRDEITGGELWRAQIVEAIENCDTFILIISSSSVRSKYVLQELNIADSEGKRIIPAMIEPVEIPKEMKLQLSGLQIINLAEDLEDGWNALWKSI